MERTQRFRVHMMVQHRLQAALQNATAFTSSTPMRKATTAAAGNMDPPACEGRLHEPPNVLLKKPALDDLRNLLHPKQKHSPGHIDPEINHFFRTTTYNKWGASSFQAAISLGRGRHCAWQLCNLVQQFIKDKKNSSNKSIWAMEQMTTCWQRSSQWNQHLLSINWPRDLGPEAHWFCHNNTALRSQHEIEKKISIKTSQRDLNALVYRYSTPLKGQYADGHECKDVVHYRDQIFSAWKSG